MVGGHTVWRQIIEDQNFCRSIYGKLFAKIIFEDCGQGGATPILFNHTSNQETLQPLRALLHAFLFSP